MYWMNVDRPLKSAILHQAGCLHLSTKRGTAFKGIDEMKRDGGWFSFRTYLDAKDFFAREVSGFGIERMKPCDDCL